MRARREAATSLGSRTTTIVAAIGVTVRQNGSSNESRGSFHAMTSDSDWRGAERILEDRRGTCAERIKALVVFPPWLEHGRQVP